MCASVDERWIPYIPFWIGFILCQINITYINFKTYEEYLRELESVQRDGQTDRQMECINVFQLCWKEFKNDLLFFFFLNLFAWSPIFWDHSKLIYVLFTFTAESFLFKIRTMIVYKDIQIILILYSLWTEAFTAVKLDLTWNLEPYSNFLHFS